MTRRGTAILALGVCIGTIFLLFGVAAAEVTEASTAVSRNDSDFQKASTPRRILTTTLTRVTPTRQEQKEKDGRNVDATSRDARDGVGSDKSQIGERSDASSQTTRWSSEDTDSSSGGSSDGSRKPRYGEISAESSGKSSSTKTVSEESLRLSRTNELTVATAKPTSNDSRQDGKKGPANATLQESVGHEETSNVTVLLPNVREKPANEILTADTMKNTDFKRADPATGGSSIDREERRNVTANTEEVMTVKSIGDSLATSPRPRPMPEDVVKLDEKRGKIIKPDYSVASKTESRKEKNATSHDLKDREVAEDHDLEEERDRELIAEHDVSPSARKNAIDVGTTASEALDLERIDEKGHEGVISLINDTYVNYKTEIKDGARNHSTGVSGGSRGVGDPKEEVEVVANVTHQPILKIVAVANDTARNDSRFNQLGGRDQVIFTKKEEEIVANKHEDGRSEERKIAASSIANATVESANNAAEERRSIGEAENQVKLPEITTASVRHDDRRTTSTPEVIPSPIPQGRTIGFSGVNEFPSVEAKSTVSTTTTTTMKANSGTETIANTRTNSSAEETRPYPYLKSGREASQATTEAGSKLGSGDVTVETSAYENTIGREESEKKFVVTEASVVIENSIQQRRPDERNANDSTNSSTESSSSLASVTVMPITSVVVAPTNVTLPDGFNGGAKRAETKDASSSEDDASVAKQQDEGYDVTGNGITEVSLNAETNGRSDSEAAGLRSATRTTEPSMLSRSTEMPITPKAASLNTDIQTDPEEAMMIRSTLVVTESTIMPLGKGAATEANKSMSASTTSSAEIDSVAATTVRENSTRPANVTLQPFAWSSNTTEAPFTTLNPDESSIPTTTSVEFEFVGLTEAASPSGNNATERNVSERTTEGRTRFSQTTIQDTSAGSNLTEGTTTTRSEDSTELPTTTEDGTPTTDQMSTTSNETTEVEGPPTTQPTVVEERHNRSSGSTRNDMTTSAVDLTSLTTTVTDAIAITSVTDSPSESKNSSFDARNITETIAPSTTVSLSSSGTPRTANATSTKDSSAPPFATSTLEPRILWSTPGFTDSPDEETTDSIQTLSPDEITLLVKIVIEGTLHEICPRMQDLRKALADVVNNGVDRHVLPNQIVIHQNPCPEPTGSSPTPADVTLTSILVYVVDEEGKFDAATTKILPSLYKMSHNFPVKIHKFLLVQETDSGNAIAVVVVSSVAFICLVLLAGLLFIMRKRQTRFNYGERCRPVSLDAYSLDSVSAYNSVRRKGAARSSKRSYGNPTFEDSSAIPSHPLNFAGLSTFCNDVNAINEEFTNIPQVSAKIDELPPGAEVKNRYANVIPLPETRVPLQRLNNDALTEYINASYVRGPKNATKYYIACQAPIESTVTDFWRMIWEQQCKVIIMLTDLVENGVEKCTEYIPPSEVTDCHRLYGDYQVTLKKRETKEKYAISTLHLKNLENNTFREVFHIWYLWPVSGVQSDGAGLIAVLLEARALQRGGPGPIVVHCSPGTGRTGTLIALDLGIRQYEITRTVDVPRVVYTIRRDRAGAVQTKEQYAFIYKALNLYATKLAGGVLEST